MMALLRRVRWWQLYLLAAPLLHVASGLRLSISEQSGQTILDVGAAISLEIKLLNEANLVSTAPSGLPLKIQLIGMSGTTEFFTFFAQGTKLATVLVKHVVAESIDIQVSADGVDPGGLRVVFIPGQMPTGQFQFVAAGENRCCIAALPRLCPDTPSALNHLAGTMNLQARLPK